MSIYARLDGVTAAEILELEVDPAQLFHPSIKLVDVSHVEPQPLVGWLYIDDAWHAPYVPEPIIESPWLTSNEFMALLTNDEQHAMAAAGQASPAVFLWLLKMAGASYIDLSDPQTIGGVQAMTAAGLLSAARAADVLANKPAPALIIVETPAESAPAEPAPAEPASAEEHAS
jgi:hypothetical protein